jgi:glycosyltransferase involved in cell wall biosynthesis
MTTSETPSLKKEKELAGIRVLKVQSAGDYREAHDYMAAGGAETYYAQRYSIESDAVIGGRVEQMGVLCCRTNEEYDVVVENGVRAMGAGLAASDNPDRAISLIERFAPTHLVAAAAVPSWMRWALRRNVKVLPMLACSFSPTFGNVSLPRRLIKNWRHSRWRSEVIEILNSPQINWVANHNWSSSVALNKLGVAADKIVPWDWPPVVQPDGYSAKKHPDAGHPWKIAYVGVVSEAKGVGDLLDAIVQLNAQGHNISAQIIGSGEPAVVQRFSQRVQHLCDRVTFTGRIPHPAAVAAIRSADIMVVPSRHDYPEGMPCTIHETLAVRTPLICSDHPMFVESIQDGFSAMVFSERKPEHLASHIKRLMTDPSLYGQLSANAAEAWERLQIATKYSDLLQHWIGGTAADRQWLQERTLFQLMSTESKKR